MKLLNGTYNKECKRDVFKRLAESFNSLPGLQVSAIGNFCGCIWLKCTDLKSVKFLGRCLDRRYGGHPTRMILTVVNSDCNENHTTFQFELKELPNEKGFETMMLVESFINNMNYHLNHVNYMKAFMHDYKGFKYREHNPS